MLSDNMRQVVMLQLRKVGECHCFQCPLVGGLFIFTVPAGLVDYWILLGLSYGINSRLTFEKLLENAACRCT